MGKLMLSPRNSSRSHRIRRNFDRRFKQRDQSSTTRHHSPTTATTTATTTARTRTTAMPVPAVPSVADIMDGIVNNSQSLQEFATSVEAYLRSSSIIHPTSTTATTATSTPVDSALGLEREDRDLLRSIVRYSHDITSSLGAGGATTDTDDDDDDNEDDECTDVEPYDGDEEDEECDGNSSDECCCDEVDPDAASDCSEDDDDNQDEADAENSEDQFLNYVRSFGTNNPDRPDYDSDSSSAVQTSWWDSDEEEGDYPDDDDSGNTAPSSPVNVIYQNGDQTIVCPLGDWLNDWESQSANNNGESTALPIPYSLRHGRRMFRQYLDSLMRRESRAFIL